MNTPVLETVRLILRPFRQEDAQDVFCNLGERSGGCNLLQYCCHSMLRNCELRSFFAWTDGAWFDIYCFDRCTADFSAEVYYFTEKIQIE